MREAVWSLSLCLCLPFPSFPSPSPPFPSLPFLRTLSVPSSLPSLTLTRLHPLPLFFFPPSLLSLATHSSLSLSSHATHTITHTHCS